MKPIKRPRKINWLIIHYRFSGFLAFLILFTGISYIIFQRYHLLKQKEKNDMSTILLTVEQNINQTIKNGYSTALSLALTINDKGTPEDFENISKKLIETNPNIDILQLIPNGIVKYSYPLKGNEGALNLNILEYPTSKKDALQAIATKKMYFTGPINLKQGGIGFIGRFPIFKQNKFWGFSTIIIELDKMIKASGIQNFDASKFYFQFSKTNANTNTEEFYLPNKEDFSNKNFQKIKIIDGNWKVYVINKNDFAVFYDVFPLAFFGILFSVLVGFFVALFFKKPSELQEIVKNQAAKIINSE